MGKEITNSSCPCFVRIPSFLCQRSQCALQNGHTESQRPWLFRAPSVSTGRGLTGHRTRPRSALCSPAPPSARRPERLRRPKCRLTVWSPVKNPRRNYLQETHVHGEECPQLDGRCSPRTMQGLQCGPRCRTQLGSDRPQGSPGSPDSKQYVSHPKQVHSKGETLLTLNVENKHKGLSG